MSESVPGPPRGTQVSSHVCARAGHAVWLWLAQPVFQVAALRLLLVLFGCHCPFNLNSCGHYQCLTILGYDENTGIFEHWHRDGDQAQCQCLGQAAWVVDRCPRNAYAPWCQPSLPRSSRLAQMDSMSLRMQLPSLVRAGALAVPSLIELSCVFSSTHAIDLLDPLPSPVWSLPDSDHWHGIPIGSSSSSSSHISKLPIAKTRHSSRA